MTSVRVIFGLFEEGHVEARCLFFVWGGGYPDSKMLWGPSGFYLVTNGLAHLAQMGPRGTQMGPTIGPSIYTRVTYWAPDGPCGFYVGPTTFYIWVKWVLYGPHMGYKQVFIWDPYGPSGFDLVPYGPSGSEWASYCLNGFYFYPVEFIYPISISRVTSWV